MNVTYRGDLQPGWQARIDHWLAGSAEFLDVEFGPLQIQVTKEDYPVPADVEMAASDSGLLLRPKLLTLPDPVRELTLAKYLQEGLAQVAVMRLGIASVSIGTTLISLGGSWALYRAFYGPGGPFEDDDLRMNPVEPNDLNGLGMALGAALAGSAEALRVWTDLAGGDGPAQVFKTLLSDWSSVDTFPQLLGGIKAIADEFKRRSGELP
jgi:hypothetical protein